MGYMLFNERMLESYLHAKKWLKPSGKYRRRLDFGRKTFNSCSTDIVTVPSFYQIVTSKGDECCIFSTADYLVVVA